MRPEPVFNRWIERLSKKVQREKPKNVRSDDPAIQELHVSTAYLASLQDYADIVGTPLKLAIFWLTWKFWSVISPEQFRAEGW